MYFIFNLFYLHTHNRGAGWLNELSSWIT